MRKGPKILNINTKNTVHTIPPFYFIVVFWGQTYRDYFLNLLLASLLSPNNIPALDNLKNCKFLICTTMDDWHAIQNTSIFQLMTTYIQPVFIEMEFPAANALKMLVMSKGHKLASEIAFNAKAIGVFVTPDLILSDGSVVAMQKLAKQGKTVVLCAAIRFEYYGCLEAFQRLNVLQPGKPLILTGRQLMSVALNNLHSETIRYLWKTNHFAETPISCLFSTSNGIDYIVHTFSWAPLVCNYSALTKHSTQTFEEWTLDGNYIHCNFGHNIKDIYTVTDSDEIALVSFTKETDLHIPAVPQVLQDIPFWGNLVKMENIHKLYHNLTIMDPLKQKLFLKTVFFHSNGITKDLIKTSKKAKYWLLFAVYFNIPIISIYRAIDYVKQKYLEKKDKYPSSGVSFLPELIASVICHISIKKIKPFLNYQILRIQWLQTEYKNRNFSLIFYKIKRRLSIWFRCKSFLEKEKPTLSVTSNHESIQ